MRPAREPRKSFGREPQCLLVELHLHGYSYSGSGQENSTQHSDTSFWFGRISDIALQSVWSAAGNGLIRRYPIFLILRGTTRNPSKTRWISLSTGKRTRQNAWGEWARGRDGQRSPG
jgi:hypothetical protein